MDLLNFKAMLRRHKNYVPPGTLAPRELARFATSTHGANDGVNSDLVLYTYEEDVVLNGASTNLGLALPNRARVLDARRLNLGAVVLTTAVKLGLGTGASPSKYLLTSTDMTDGAPTANGTNPNANADVVVTSPAPTTGGTDQLVLSAVDTGGAAAGTAVGTVRVSITYWAPGYLVK